MARTIRIAQRSMACALFVMAFIELIGLDLLFICFILFIKNIVYDFKFKVTRLHKTANNTVEKLNG